MKNSFPIPFPTEALRFAQSVREFRETYPDVPEHIAAEIMTDAIEESVDPDEINEYHSDQIRLNYYL